RPARGGGAAGALPAEPAAGRTRLPAVGRRRARPMGAAPQIAWKIGADGRHHSGLIWAARITLAHFSVSSARSLPNAAGVSASAVPPRSAKRALILGSARPIAISPLSLSTIAAGVFLGAPTPSQSPASKPRTNSPTVGTSRSASHRRSGAPAGAR